MVMVVFPNVPVKAQTNRLGGGRKNSPCSACTGEVPLATVLCLL